jgi:competence ComEA-like helix-hairpin-helix protein
MSFQTLRPIHLGGPTADFEAPPGIRRRPAVRSLAALCVAFLLMLATGVQAGGDDGSTRVDLNRATAQELESLPGIGAAKAAAILAERESSGGFESIDDLEAVRGIGPSLVEKLRPHVRLGAVQDRVGR